MQQQAVAERILNIDELAEYLRIAKSSLYKLAQEGKVPGQKVGRHWRFRKQAIDAWLDQKSEMIVQTDLLESR